jgi:hypothetical protein
VYKIEVSDGNTPTGYRSVRVNQDTSPELYITGDFDKTNYSPGDFVNQKIKVRRPDGNKLPGGSRI